MSIKDLSQSILEASKSVLELSELKVTMQIVPGSEKKIMPLAKKAGVRFQKPKPGDDEAHVMGDKKSLRKFMMMRGMSAGDIEDSHPELKEDVDPKKERLKQKRAKFNQEIEKAREQIKRIEKQEVQADKAGDDLRGARLSVDRVDLYHKIGYFQDKLDDMKEAKKLDPVGKADADIDNDGDTDSSDEYLKKRRAAISKAMNDEGNKFTGALAKAKEMGEKTFTCAGKQYTVDEVEPIMKGDEEGKKKIVKEKDVKEEYDKDFKSSKHTAGDVSRLDPKEKAGYSKLKAAFIQRNKGEDDMEAAESDEMYNRGKKQKEAANKKLDMLRKQYKASTVKAASSDSHNYGENKESTMMSGKPEKKNIYQVRKDMQKSVKDANAKLKDAEQRKKDRIKKMQDDESGMKKEEIMNDLLPILEKYDIELISEIIGNVRMPDAGKDSSGIRKAVGKDSDSSDDSSGMDNKEKVGYNALLSIAKKLNKAYNDEATAQNDEAEERAIDQVQKFRAEFNSKAKFYKDATVSKARADAKKAVPSKERDRG